METISWRLDENYIDASKKHSARLASIGYVMTNGHATIIMAMAKQIGLSYSSDQIFGYLWSNYDCNSEESSYDYFWK